MALTSERAREIQALRTVHRGGRRSRQETAIRQALDAGLPTAEVIEALRQAVLDGKQWAIALWLAYRWGRPGAAGDEGPGDLPAQDPRELTDEELAAIARENAPRTGDRPVAPPAASTGAAHRPR